MRGCGSPPPKIIITTVTVAVAVAVTVTVTTTGGALKSLNKIFCRQGAGDRELGCIRMGLALLDPFFRCFLLPFLCLVLFSLCFSFFLYPYFFLFLLN